MQGTCQGIGQRAEEVRDHLCRQITHLLAAEGRIELQVRAAGKIQCTLCQAFVHRQAKAKATDTSLVTEGFSQSFAQGQSGIFYAVVIVDVQIAVDSQFHAEAAVGGDLI